MFKRINWNCENEFHANGIIEFYHQFYIHDVSKWINLILSPIIFIIFPISNNMPGCVVSESEL